MKRGGIAIVLAYLIVGSYFVNSAFGFIPMPEFIMNIHKWITLAGGALIIVSGLKFLQKKA